MCDSREERAHFASVVHSLRSYKPFALGDVMRTEQYFNSLPQHHRSLMSSYHHQFQKMKECINKNDELVLKALHCDRMFLNVDHHVPECDPSVPARDMSTDLPRIESVFKHIYRDWSTAGAKERELCYKPLLDELVNIYPQSEYRHNISVLVPGAGLGRLVFEIARMGFDCQGNEFSLFMMFFSQFILNRCSLPNEHKVYPWVHQVVNVYNNSDQIDEIRFPDISPNIIGESPTYSLSMAAGDFLEVYRIPDSWDCVVTCFFVDCAHNIADFVETIYRILKPGGHWLNLGPLLYHYSNSPNESSIEPSYEVVRGILEGFGFHIQDERTLRTVYCQNPNSMMRFEYDSIFFHCVKPNQETDFEAEASSSQES